MRRAAAEGASCKAVPCPCRKPRLDIKHAYEVSERSERIRESSGAVTHRESTAQALRSYPILSTLIYPIWELFFSSSFRYLPDAAPKRQPYE